MKNNNVFKLSIILLFFMSVASIGQNKQNSTSKTQEFTKITNSTTLFKVWHKVNESERLTFLAYMHALLEIEKIETISVKDFLDYERKEGSCVVGILIYPEQPKIYGENYDCDFSLLGLRFDGESNSEDVKNYFRKLDACTTLEKFKKTMYNVQKEQDFDGDVFYFYGEIVSLGYGYYVGDFGRKTGGSGTQIAYKIDNGKINTVDIWKSRDLLEKKLSSYVDINVNRDYEFYELKIGSEVAVRNDSPRTLTIGEVYTPQKDRYIKDDGITSSILDGVTFDNEDVIVLDVNKDYEEYVKNIMIKYFDNIQFKN